MLESLQQLTHLSSDESVDLNYLFIIRLLSSISVVVLLLYYFLPLPTAIQTQATLLPGYHLIYWGAVVIFIFTAIAPLAVNRLFRRMPLSLSVIGILGIFWSVGNLAFFAVVPHPARYFALPFFMWLIGMPLLASHYLAYVRRDDRNYLLIQPTIQLSHRRLVWAVSGAIVLLGSVLLLPWQSVVPTPLKPVISLSAFLLPGILLVSILLPTYNRVTRLIMFGLPLSILIFAIPFLLIWRLGGDMQILSFWWFGITLVVGAYLIVSQRGKTICYPQVKIHWHYFPLGMSLVFLVTITVFVAWLYTLYHPWATSYDALSYNTYITYFVDASSYQHVEPYLGTGNPTSYRFLLSPWPGVLAFLVFISDSHIFLMHGMLLCSFVFVSHGIIYELARTLDFSRKQAILAVMIYSMVLLIMETSRYATRDYMFSRLLEDKFFAAYLLFPILAQSLILYFKKRQWRYFAVWICCAVSMMFLHPTMLLFSCSILGVYCVWQMIFSHHWQAAILAVAVMVICMSPFVFIRRTFDTDERIMGSVEEYVYTHRDTHNITYFTDDYTGYVTNRLYVFNGGEYYMISPMSLMTVGFMILVTSGIVALFRFKNTHQHAFLLAYIVILTITIIPLTSSLIGRFSTPSQLVRLNWFMPFAIAGIFIIQHIPSRFKAAIKNDAGRLLMLNMFIILLLVFVILPGNSILVEFDRELPSSSKIQLNSDHAALAQFFETELDEPTIVYSQRELLRDRIPALSEHTHTLFFRLIAIQRTQTGLSESQLDKRYDAYIQLLDPRTDRATWLSLVDQYNIEYVITQPGDTLHLRAQQDLNQYFAKVFEHGDFDVYRIANTN